MNFPIRPITILNVILIAFFGAVRRFLSQFFGNYRQDILAGNMIDDFERVGDVLKWNRRFFTIGGVWPLESTYVRSTIWVAYLAIHLSMQYAELYANLGELELVVNNVVETVFQTMVIAKLIVIRHSKTLRSLIIAVQEDLAIKNYENFEEKEIYKRYNFLAKLFFKLTIPTITAGSMMYYLVPMEHFIRTIYRNDTNPFVLPFRTRIFFDMNDVRTYLMVYAYQSPMIYVLVCHSAWFCLLTTVVLHICGQLAVLQYRIKNIKVSLIDDNDNSNEIFRRLAERHLRSIWMAKSMDDAFNLILLQDLAGSTLLLGLTSYLALMRTETDVLVFCIAIVCAITMLFLLYAYCIVGEFLIDESTKVHEAYYLCNWYESSFNFRKCLSICIVATQEPLHLSAGKAYIFCLNGFTDVLRTAMGYLSLLRNFA